MLNAQMAGVSNANFCKYILYTGMCTLSCVYCMHIYDVYRSYDVYVFKYRHTCKHMQYFHACISLWLAAFYGVNIP